MKKIETSALIGLGALGILFGRKMPGVKVIADAERVARYSAQPVVCNGKECHFDYVTPEQGQPVDLVLVAVKATVLEQAIKDIEKFVGPMLINLLISVPSIHFLAYMVQIQGFHDNYSAYTTTIAIFILICGVNCFMQTI